MTASQQKNAKKVKNISIEMQRNRYETYRGQLRFKPNYRLCAVKGSTSVWLWGMSLMVLSLRISFNIVIWYNTVFCGIILHIQIEYN